MARPRVLSPAQIEHARRKLGAGFSLTAAAGQVGVDPKTLKTALSREPRVPWTGSGPPPVSSAVVEQFSDFVEEQLAMLALLKEAMANPDLEPRALAVLAREHRETIESLRQFRAQTSPTLRESTANMDASARVLTRLAQLNERSAAIAPVSPPIENVPIKVAQ